MRVQIADIIYNQEQATLSSGSETTVLEPKANALLTYFCNHPHTDISRDQLMQDVWRGQIVSDNAINRVIVQLRKALGDEQTPRQFISTVPKYGYRLVADVKPVSEISSETADKTRGHQRLLMMALAGLVVIGLGLLLMRGGLNPGSDDVSNQKLAPLSRLSNWQFEAELSGDQRNLVYSISVEDNVELHMTNIDTQSALKISEDDGYAYAGHWSHAGDKIIYQYIKDQRCEFHQIEMKDGVPQPPSLLQNCIPTSYTTFSYSPDDQILYFVERQDRYSPYELFALDIEQQHKWRLSQPLPKALGNHYLNVHPETGRILLLAESTPGESSVFVIDVASNSYEKLVEFDYRIGSAVWGHESNTIVHPGKHPSYELIETNWRSGVSKVLVSDSRRITHPKRINNQKDYLFTSYLNNLDIAVDGSDSSTFNSAVMDYLPSLSRDSQRLAFISKRSGYSKVWIKGFDTDELFSIEPDDTGRTFYSLDWSFDNQEILANTNRGLIVFDVENREVKHTLKLDQQAYAAYWYSGNHISYSHYEDGRWQIYLTDLQGEQVEKLDSDFAFVTSDGQRMLYLDQEFEVLDQAGAPIEKSNGLSCGRTMMRYQLTVQLDGDSFYCLDSGESSNLLQWRSAEEGYMRMEGVLEGAHYYSMKNATLVKTNQANAYSDIMRTDF